MSKKWTLLFFLIIISLAISSFYLSTHWEEINGTKDTDGDGLTDYEEVNTYQTLPHTPDSDSDGLSDYDEVIVYHTDARNIDSDGDFVADNLEVNCYNTDPLKIDTSGLGLDDYNAIYTYGIDQRNQTAVKEFLEKIPNVEARHWNLDEDGGNVLVNVGYLEKVNIISNRDPLLQWLAKHSTIEWEPGMGAYSGETVGRLMINGEVAHKGPHDPSEVYSIMNHASYYFTHGRLGCCVESAEANLVILNLMNDGKYKATQVDGRLGDTGHEWCEALIDGKIFVVDHNAVVPRESCHELGSYVTEHYGFDQGNIYDPDWYLK